MIPASTASEKAASKAPTPPSIWPKACAPPPRSTTGNTNPHSDFARQILQYDKATQSVLLTSIVPGLFGGAVEMATLSPDGGVKVQSGYGGFRDSA